MRHTELEQAVKLRDEYAGKKQPAEDDRPYHEDYDGVKSCNTVRVK